MPPRASSGPAIATRSLLLAVALAACGGDPETGPGTRGSLAVIPQQLHLAPGGKYYLFAFARDPAGHDLPVSDITWRSNAPGIAKVDSAGLVSAEVTGVARVLASVAGVTDTVVVTVAPAGAVTVSPGSTSITVGASRTFTATARDSNGAPISGPITWSVDASAIASVDAAGRVTGLAVGQSTLRAAVDGLVGTALVQVTAAVVQVGSVAVSPAQSTVEVGDAAPFNAVANDRNGDPIAGAPISWSSANTAVASVGSNGMALGRTPGDARIDATAGGVTGSATLHVVAGATNGGNWPHEPSGFTPISEQPWNVADLLEWVTQFGTVSIGIDLTAPLSPPDVLTITYPLGFAGGSAPGTVFRLLPGGHRYYFATWWKPSNPWQGHDTNVNKILFFFPATNGDMTMVMYGHPGGPYEIRVLPQFEGIASDWLLPNIATVPVTLGTWHRLEWLIDYGDDTGTGTVRWWMDGQMLGSYTNVPFPTGLGGAVFKISPTWGGVGDTKNELDFFWFDDTYLSYQP